MQQTAKVKIEHNNGDCHLYINGVDIASLTRSYELKASAGEPVTLSLEVLPGKLEIECDEVIVNPNI